jgi:hypothetical protein
MAADPLLPSLSALPHEEQLPTMASEEAIIDDAPVAHSFTTPASSPPWLAHQRGRSRNFQSTLSVTVSPSDHHTPELLPGQVLLEHAFSIWPSSVLVVALDHRVHGGPPAGSPPSRRVVARCARAQLLEHRVSPSRPPFPTTFATSSGFGHGASGEGADAD